MVFSNNLLMGAAGQGGGYEIDQSIRFNAADSAYLEKTYGSSESTLTAWSFSAWVKRSKLGAEQWLFAAGTASSNLEYLRFTSGDKLEYKLLISSSLDSNYITSQLFRDPSAWMHIYAYRSSTTFKLYINGSEVTDFSTSNAPGSSDGQFGKNYRHRIGTSYGTPSNFLGAYLAEMNFVPGTAKAVTDFGETNDDGVWIPKAYDGSYGTNGFYITGETASDLGEDFSGNGNDFTSSGLATTDQMLDTPTDNFCTMSPINSYSGLTLADGNLTVSAGAQVFNKVNGTFWIDADQGGAWYYEYTVGSNNDQLPGWTGSERTDNYPGQGLDSYSYAWARNGGAAYNPAGSTGAHTGSGTYVSGDVLGWLIDFDNNEVKVGKVVSGTWSAIITWTDLGTYKDGGPAGGAWTATDRPYNGNGTFNFGQTGGFTAITAPGQALKTSNLATPSIKDGSAHFDTSLWTGNDTDGRAITGYNFQPDWVWIKSRSGAYSHSLTDAVRGAGIYLQSNTSDQEVTGPGAFGSTLAFTSDGYTLDNGTSDNLYVNAGGETYVGWAWNANGAGSSNTDGDITSTVSANTTAGFSIATYTGNALSSQTIGHGLGQIPSLVMFKELDSSSYSWQVYHASLGYTQRLILDGTNAAISATNIFSAAPTSTVFTVGNSAGINTNSASHVMYSFAEIPGYSSFGSYTGNGSTDGTFVYTGFKPAFIMYKVTSTTDSWEMYDTTRQTFNVYGTQLKANLSNAETDDTRIDILSNGFKARSTNTAVNASGASYIYMAFAEHPFGGDGAAPATAR